MCQPTETGNTNVGAPVDQTMLRHLNCLLKRRQLRYLLVFILWIAFRKNRAYADEQSSLSCCIVLDPTRGISNRAG